MKTWFLAGVVLAFACQASAAPNVTNTVQKGSLLVFPDIDVRGTTNTLVRIANDGGLAVDIKCYWMDGNKNRTDFAITLTRGQAAWFDARTGHGTSRIGRFPQFQSNGFDNPFLGGPNADPYLAGLLVCFAVDTGEQNQIKWNHLSGTATVYDSVRGTAYEYSPHAFFVQGGIDQAALGTPGALYLNGVDYDSCPLYQIGQMSPAGSTLIGAAGPLQFVENRLAIAGCTLGLNQDWVPLTTKLQFDVWNGEEVKFSGAFECADSWHETTFTDVDAAPQNFMRSNLATDAARYRLQGVKSTQCQGSQAVGLVAVQSTSLDINGRALKVATALTAAGKFLGRISWDPSDAVPEGGIRQP